MQCENCSSKDVETRDDEGDTLMICHHCGLIVENGVETQKGVDPELFDLIEEYNSIGEEIVKRLPEGEMECQCNRNYGSFEYIHWGKFPEIMSVCLRCGGMKEIKEEV